MNRFSGRLHTWNEEGGYGFIRPGEGGQDIFVHVSSLPKPRPGPEEVLTFAVALNAQGKKKAVDVRLQQVEQQGLAADRSRTHRRPDERVTRHESGRRSKWPAAVVTLVLLGSLGAYVHKKVPWSLLEATEAAPSQTSVPEPAPAREARFHCDGRTMCSQMTSCEEATFFLKNCPGTKMDGNNDGVPCERQFCR